MEKIIIHQFAGLKDISLETGPITVIIGPQATGKSVTAKLIFFFREIGSQLLAATTAGEGLEDFKTECKKKFFRYFPCDSWGKENFSITYKTNGQQLRVEFNHIEGKSAEESFSIIFSDFYQDALKRFGHRWSELASDIPEGDSAKREAVIDKFREELYGAMMSALGPWSKFQQIFVPAGRAFFSLLEASVFRTLESGQDLDPFLVSFGAFLEQSKGVLYERRLFSNRTRRSAGMKDFQQALSTMLKGDFQRIRRHNYLRYSDGRRVRLAQASSGQQEALPLLLVLGRFWSLGHVSGRAVYIEEPEAHLFPATQRKIVEFMAEMFRARADEMCIVMTTHSPYILTALNNLMQAGNRYQQADASAAKKLEKIIPQSRSLHPGEVAAFALEDGNARSIICPTTKLIDAQMIDDVSSDIAVQFDSLLEDL
jgi:hypothetical protein